MSKNIKEFTATQIINYLKERDEEIQRLKRGIEKFQSVTNSIKECPKCKEWIFEAIHLDDLRACAGCEISMCKKCRKTNGFFSPIRLATNLFSEMWFCGECKNSGYPPTAKPIYL